MSATPPGMHATAPSGTVLGVGLGSGREGSSSSSGGRPEWGNGVGAGAVGTASSIQIFQVDGSKLNVKLPDILRFVATNQINYHTTVAWEGCTTTLGQVLFWRAVAWMREFPGGVHLALGTNTRYVPVKSILGMAKEMNEGKLNFYTPVWTEGLPSWIPFGQMLLCGLPPAREHCSATPVHSRQVSNEFGSEFTPGKTPVPMAQPTLNLASPPTSREPAQPTLNLSSPPTSRKPVVPAFSSAITTAEALASDSQELKVDNQVKSRGKRESISKLPNAKSAKKRKTTKKIRTDGYSADQKTSHGISIVPHSPKYTPIIMPKSLEEEAAMEKEGLVLCPICGVKIGLRQLETHAKTHESSSSSNSIDSSNSSIDETHKTQPVTVKNVQPGEHSWQCDRCTFKNQIRMNFCQMCSAKRPVTEEMIEREKQKRDSILRGIQDQITILQCRDRDHPIEIAKQAIVAQLDVVGVEKERTSLLDPLTRERIAIPARGRECKHIQCFDLEQYLTYAQLLGKNTIRKTYWKCPICNKHCKLEDIKIDTFMQKVLADTSEDFILVTRDGTIETVKGEPPKSSKQKRRERYCFIDLTSPDYDLSKTVPFPSKTVVKNEKE